MILLTIKEVCDKCRISRNTAYKLFNRPDFPKIKIGNKLLVDEQDLKRYLLRWQTYIRTGHKNRTLKLK